MTEPLFDRHTRALRRDRAARRGPALFLLQRAFDDCLDRLGDVRREFGSALLIGCPDPAWRASLKRKVLNVAVVDPGRLFAAAADGRFGDEDLIDLPPGAYDLCLAVGTLDTVPDLQSSLLSIRRSLQPDSLFFGAVIGGDTLPMLRAAMRAADRTRPAAVAHVHPRIEASALAPLLSAAGFEMPVVDIDRVTVTYSSFDRLVDDLRAMAATNILCARGRDALSRTARDAARREFSQLGDGEATHETFEILHFAAWTRARQS
ncbi:MAG TPA: methyltransferase domain-containing protein [Sphingomicrobium sp.]|nr:methyltransferase domain-containing protein [Sphingomicrobium sp.]